MTAQIQRIRKRSERRNSSKRDGLGDRVLGYKEKAEYRWVMRQLICRTGGKCEKCGEPVERHDPESLRYATIDHIIPISRGGADTIQNKALLCRGCNQEKADTL